MRDETSIRQYTSKHTIYEHIFLKEKLILKLIIYHIC